MKSNRKMPDLMQEVSNLMLTLGARDTIMTMQRVLLDSMPAKDGPGMSWPYESRKPAYDGDMQAPLQDTKNDLAEGARFLQDSLTNHAGTRHYKLYVPSCYRGQPLPLVVMLHGCKQDADDFAIGTRMNRIAEEKQCLVVYPEQAKSASRPQCWNWFYAANQLRESGEPSIIADITREVIRQYGVDESMVYIAGLSAGGAMAAIMATNYPDIFAAAAVHSGMPYSAARDLYSALSAMKHGPRKRRPNLSASDSAEPSPTVPMIVFHGDADTVVHPSNGDQVLSDIMPARGDETFGAAAASSVVEGESPAGRSFTRTLHHDEFGQNVAEQWLIHGGGHAWSGGCAHGSFTDPLGPDATNEMMRFFYGQARPDRNEAISETADSGFPN